MALPLAKFEWTQKTSGPVFLKRTVVLLHSEPKTSAAVQAVHVGFVCFSPSHIGLPENPDEKQISYKVYPMCEKQEFSLE